MAVIRPIEASRSIDIGGVPDTRVDGSIGQGLSQVGGAISNHAEMQNQMALRRQQMENQDEEFAANQALIRWNDDNSLEFAKQQGKIDPSGKGFTDNMSGVYTERSEKFLKGVPDRLRPKMAELVSTAKNQLIDKATAIEIDQRNSWRRNGIAERQQTLQTQVFNDPSTLDASKADVYRLIDSSGFPEAEVIALKKQTDEMFSLTIGEREIRDAEANPASATNAASRLGVPSAGRAESYRNAIASIESNGSGGYAAVGPTNPKMGRALGRYQVMEANIAPWSREALGREVSAEEFMANPKIQDAVFDHKFGGYVRQHGLEGAAQAWFAGPGGVGRSERKDILGTDVGSYGKKFIAALGRGEESADGQAPTDPRFANLTLTQRLMLYDKIQDATRKGQVQQRTALSLDMENASASYLATGGYQGPPVTKGRIMAAYGPEEGGQRWSSFEAMQRTGQAIQGMKTLSDSAITAQVAALKPTSTASPTFAVDMNNYNAAQQAAGQIIQQRQSDPAGYVQQNFPSVNSAMQAYQSSPASDKQTSAATVYKAMDGAFDAIGTPARLRSYLTAQSAQETSKTVNDRNIGFEDRMGALLAPIMATSDPKQQRQIFEQMVRTDSSFAKYESAVEAFGRGDAAGARRLFQAGMTDFNKIPGKLTYTDADIKQKIADTIMGDGQIGDATYGFSLNAIGGEERAQRDGSLMIDAVKYQMLSNGGDISNAIDQVKKDIYGNKQVVDRGNVYATASADTDAYQLSAALGAKSMQARDALMSYVRPKIDVSTLPGDQRGSYEQARIRETMIAESKLSSGIWHNYDDGYAFFDTETGMPVYDQKGGMVFVKSTDIGTVVEPLVQQGPSVFENPPQSWDFLALPQGDSSLPTGVNIGNVQAPNTQPQTVKSGLLQQRNQLFKNAQDSGLLNGGSQ